MGFSRQEYWSGLPCPPPGDLSDPGIEPISLMSPSSGPSKSSLTWTSNKHHSPSSPKNGFIPPREAHLAFSRSQWLPMPVHWVQLYPGVWSSPQLDSAHLGLSSTIISPCASDAGSTSDQASSVGRAVAFHAYLEYLPSALCSLFRHKEYML